MSGNYFCDFGNGNGNSSAHSQILGTGMGMKIAFPTFGNGNGNEKLHSRYLGMGTEMKIAFPTFGNGNETLVFPGMVGNGNGNDFKNTYNIVPKCRGVILNPTFWSNLYVFHCKYPKMLL